MGVETGAAEDRDTASKVARMARVEVTVQADLATAAAEATAPETGVQVEADATVLAVQVKEEVAHPTIECTQRVARTHLQNLDP